MLSKYTLGKLVKVWDLYLDQALFACRIKTSRTTKTSPFYLIYGQQPKLVGDPTKVLPNDATPEGHERRLELVQSAGSQATCGIRRCCQEQNHARCNCETAWARRGSVGPRETRQSQEV